MRKIASSETGPEFSERKVCAVHRELTILEKFAGRLGEVMSALSHVFRF
jgi:hypothetical protein